MIRLEYNERFVELDFSEYNFMKRYAISNKGRLVSFNKDILEDGIILNGSKSDGYRLFKYKKVINGKIRNYGMFIYKLVAENFLPKPTPEQKHLIHIDYVRDNDQASNLKWVTDEEFSEHVRKSPYVIQFKKMLPEIKRKEEHGKLSSTDVMRLKLMLKNPKGKKITLSRLAKQFGVSSTQIKRIISGENWSHIKV